MKQERIRVPKNRRPSVTTEKIIDQLLRLADANERIDPDVTGTTLELMNLRRRTIRHTLGGVL